MPTLDAYGLDLINRMCALDPTRRITAADALAHPYFWPDRVVAKPVAQPALRLPAPATAAAGAAHGGAGDSNNGRRLTSALVSGESSGFLDSNRGSNSFSNANSSKQETGEAEDGLSASDALLSYSSASSTASGSGSAGSSSRIAFDLPRSLPSHHSEAIVTGGGSVAASSSPGAFSSTLLAHLSRSVGPVVAVIPPPSMADVRGSSGNRNGIGSLSEDRNSSSSVATAASAFSTSFTSGAAAAARLCGDNSALERPLSVPVDLLAAVGLQPLVPPPPLPPRRILASIAPMKHATSNPLTSTTAASSSSSISASDGALIPPSVAVGSAISSVSSCGSETSGQSSSMLNDSMLLDSSLHRPASQPHSSDSVPSYVNGGTDDAEADAEEDTRLAPVLPNRPPAPVPSGPSVAGSSVGGSADSLSSSDVRMGGSSSNGSGVGAAAPGKATFQSQLRVITSSSSGTSGVSATAMAFGGWANSTGGSSGLSASGSKPGSECDGDASAGSAVSGSNSGAAPSLRGGSASRR